MSKLALLRGDPPGLPNVGMPFSFTGDPIFGFLGKIARVAGKGIGLLKRSGGARAQAADILGSLPMSNRTEIIKAGGKRILDILARHPGAVAAGGAVLSGAAGAAAERIFGMRAAGVGAPGQRGFHISKKTGKLVRNRRMRVTNPKALRRAIRRARGFAHLAKQVLSFTAARAPRGRARFRIPGRRARTR